MSEKNVRVGVIGLGARGGTYAGLVDEGRVPGMSLGGIADTDPAKRELAAQKFSDAPFYDDPLAMLDSGDVDAIVTTVPHFLHPEMTIRSEERRVGTTSRGGRC